MVFDLVCGKTLQVTDVFSLLIVGNQMQDPATTFKGKPGECGYPSAVQQKNQHGEGPITVLPLGFTHSQLLALAVCSRTNAANRSAQRRVRCVAYQHVVAFAEGDQVLESFSSSRWRPWWRS